MSRPAVILACLFWMLLLAATAYSIALHGRFHPDLYYLIGIPAGMIAATVLVGRNRSRYRVALIFGGSILAVFAALVWMGVWGADV